MLFTPEDARKMLCCTIEQKCQSWECMAWREHFDYKPGKRPVTLHPMAPSPLTKVPTGKGYCGLAGIPK